MIYRNKMNSSRSGVACGGGTPDIGIDVFFDTDCPVNDQNCRFYNSKCKNSDNSESFVCNNRRSSL